MNKKVSNLQLDSNPILEKDLLDDKVGILDIKAKIDNEVNCDIEIYQKIILTDVMEIYIIELPKFEKYKENTKNNILNSWVKFINNPEVKDMKETNKEINKAKKVLEEISQDEHERYLAELRQKYIMDQKAIEDAGYDKGLKDGLERGINEQTKIIAKNMKKRDINIKVISEITGLSTKEIEEL